MNEKSKCDDGGNTRVGTWKQRPDILVGVCDCDNWMQRRNKLADVLLLYADWKYCQLEGLVPVEKMGWKMFVSESFSLTNVLVLRNVLIQSGQFATDKSFRTNTN